MPRLRACLALLTCSLLVAGCTDNAGGHPAPAATPNNQAQTSLPAEATAVVAGASAGELAVATSRALYTRAPAVVLAAPDDQAGVSRAASAAMDLGVPLLLIPPADDPAGGLAVEVRAEVDRLDPRTLVTVGDAAAGWVRAEAAGGPASGPPASGPARSGTARPPGPTAASGSTAASGHPAPQRSAVSLPLGAADNVVLPAVRHAPALDGLLVLALNGPDSVAATATARAAGAHVLMVDNPDPRTSDKVISALAAAPPAHVLAVGSAFEPADRLRHRIDTASTGVLLPGGGQVVFPGRRLVALYGHPGDTVLGSLGEQPLDATIVRAQQVAAQYRALVKEPVVPAFEIIATVASSSPGPDGDYSNESSVESLRPWVDAARAAGIYVVLDLQPGRTDFLTQAKLYTDLLLQPNVGLALDPEWRLKPDQVHMAQIGSVGADEINRTAAWLAELTRDHRLPQKVLMLHQFTVNMITNRSTLVTDYDDLRVVIHADGFGSAGQKFNTWNTLHIDAPANVWWGWKNFYDEDTPTFTAQETVAVDPSPVFISYQ